MELELKHENVLKEVRKLMLDILFRGAKIVDGAGGPWYRGDVGVLDGRIVAVTGRKFSEESAHEVVDAGGRVLSPGFIDIHTHSDGAIFRDPVMLSKLAQGVTTQVGGQCGVSLAPVNEKYLPSLKSYLGFILAGTNLSWNWRTFDDWLKEAAELPLALNLAACVGHGTVRVAVMGFEDRKATEREIEQMKGHVSEAMSAGCFGMTSGLIYPPGVYTPKEELWELASVLAETGGLYLTHMRNESGGLLDSVAETIELGRRTGVPVQISHHKALGRDNWGLVKRSIAMVDEARSEGIDVTIDQYPYDYCSTSIRACLPPWAQADGVEAIGKRLADPAARAKIAREIEASLDLAKPCDWESMMRHSGGAKGTLVVYCPKTPQWEGKTLDEIASIMNVNPVEAAFDIIAKNDGNDLACYAAIGEDDIETVLTHPVTMVGSDSIPAAEGAKAHPRSFGTHPRILARYAREKGVLSLETAVRKMTGMPAARLGLQRKGLIHEGMDADLLVFDPETIRDEATYENPTRLASGIDSVYVAGRKTMEKGVYTGTAAGKVLRKGRY
jgi:N-acyl-D-amino-acid deacylase